MTEATPVLAWTPADPSDPYLRDIAEVGDCLDQYKIADSSHTGGSDRAKWYVGPYGDRWQCVLVRWNGDDPSCVILGLHDCEHHAKAAAEATEPVTPTRSYLAVYNGLNDEAREQVRADARTAAHAAARHTARLTAAEAVLLLRREFPTAARITLDVDDDDYDGPTVDLRGVFDAAGQALFDPDRDDEFADFSMVCDLLAGAVDWCGDFFDLPVAPSSGESPGHGLVFADLDEEPSS